MHSSVIWVGLLLAGRAAAQECLPVKPRNPEGNYIVPGVQGGIVYRRIEGRELALDAYIQKKGPERPAVVVIHGGGTSGSRIAHIGQLLELLTHAGFNWFAIDYRSHDPAAAADDVRAALGFVRCQARAFRIDPDRVAVLGEDTGADLAATARAVQATVLVGGTYRSWQGSSDRPVLMVHGTADAESPIDRVRAMCGARCEFVAVEGGIHRAENWRPAQWAFKARLAEWLARTLSLRGADHEPYRTRLQKDIAYGEPGSRLRLDAYVPPGTGPFPAVVIAHGGGWEAGDKVTYITPIFEPLAQARFAWFSIDYRLTPDVTHETQLGDLRSAVQFVQSNAEKYSVDPRRVAILGESASGQMVVQVAAEGLDAAAVVSFYGVYDFEPMVTDAGPRSLLVRLFRRTVLDEDARRLLRQFSPLHRASSTMPPLLMIHGTNERLWGQAVAMQRRLTEIGARHELYGVQGAPHGMENWEGHPEWLGYKEKLVDWLRRTLTQ